MCVCLLLAVGVVACCGALVSVWVFLRSVQVDTELWVRVHFEDGSAPTSLWHYDKFMNRLYLMREMYQVFVENGRDVYSLYSVHGYNDTNDPFVDPPTAQVIGRGIVFLDALSYMLDIDEAVPLIDYKVRRRGPACYQCSTALLCAVCFVTVLDMRPCCCSGSLCLPAR